MNLAVDVFDEPEVRSQLRPKRPSLPYVAVDASPGRAVSMNRCVDLLHEVELLGPGATGALVFENQEGQRGAILVEAGRVCWSAVMGQSRRMLDVLRGQEDSPRRSHEEFEAVSRECQASGRPFGEELVARGYVSEDGLRRALRQQTAEGIALLSRGFSVKRFLEHRKRGYEARFTFSTAEVLCAIGALQEPDVALAASNRLRELLPSGVSGAVFLRSSGASPYPIGLWEETSWTSGDLVALASWASGTLDISGAIGDQPKVVAGSDDRGQSVALWQDRGLMFAAVCKDSSALARLLMGVSRR